MNNRGFLVRFPDGVGDDHIQGIMRELESLGAVLPQALRENIVMVGTKPDLLRVKQLLARWQHKGLIAWSPWPPG